MAPHIFLLSPAHSGGLRAATLLSPKAQFELALRLRRGEAKLGEVFTFFSGLYFRGKLAYAETFGRTDSQVPAVWVITTNRGLLPASTSIDLPMLRSFSRCAIDERNSAYRLPLEQSLRALMASLPDTAQFILLGSIATGKYVKILLSVLGERLLFPVDFVGRGDMSRGALLLRKAVEGMELAYGPIEGAIRRGGRPPRLEKPSQETIATRFRHMAKPEPPDQPRREKENMDQPQEEFVQDAPPSRTIPSHKKPTRPKERTGQGAKLK